MSNLCHLKQIYLLRGSGFIRFSLLPCLMKTGVTDRSCFHWILPLKWNIYCYSSIHFDRYLWFLFFFLPYQVFEAQSENDAKLIRGGVLNSFSAKYCRCIWGMTRDHFCWSFVSLQARNGNIMLQLFSLSSSSPRLVFPRTKLHLGHFRKM